MLRRFLETWRDLPSLKLQWKTLTHADVENFPGAIVIIIGWYRRNGLLHDSYCTFSKLMSTVPSSPITIGIYLIHIVTAFSLVWHVPNNFTLFLPFFKKNFSLLITGTAKSLRWWIFAFFFLKILSRSALLIGMMWSVCITKSKRILWESLFLTDSGLCLYHLVVWWNLISCTIPSGLSFPPCPTSFCTISHHPLYWFGILSFCLHILHLLFCCVFSIFVLI